RSALRGAAGTRRCPGTEGVAVALPARRNSVRRPWHGRALVPPRSTPGCEVAPGGRTQLARGDTARRAGAPCRAPSRQSAADVRPQDGVGAGSALRARLRRNLRAGALAAP